MIKVSMHMEAILKEIAKKDRLKPEECLLKMLLDGYKERYRKDYLL
jgi:hypothetical protein